MTFDSKSIKGAYSRGPSVRESTRGLFATPSGDREKARVAHLEGASFRQDEEVPLCFVHRQSGLPESGVLRTSIYPPSEDLSTPSILLCE